MNIDKVVNPGRASDGEVFCKVRWDGKRLSISGVVGPKSNGNCRGSAGQINPVEVDTLADGWNQAALDQFNLMWELWHLNDMRAACEHQRADGWGKESLEVVTYHLSHDTGWKVKKAAEAEVVRAAIAGEVAKLSEAQKFLIGPDWFKDLHRPPGADSPLSGLCEVSKRETKLSGWVYQSEHERGVLCKPCPTCGYKYGSAWLTEEVPQSVIDFLISLPDSVKTPAWV